MRNEKEEAGDEQKEKMQKFWVTVQNCWNLAKDLRSYYQAKMPKWHLKIPQIFKVYYHAD